MGPYRETCAACYGRGHPIGWDRDCPVCLGRGTLDRVSCTSTQPAAPEAAPEEDLYGDA